MTNAIEPAFDQDDEEGVADNAASLGVDGGPVVPIQTDVEAFDDDLDDIEDESWLDEELSEEELAALGEEDFDLSEFSDADLSEEILNELQVEDELEIGSETEVSVADTDDGINIDIDGEFDDDIDLDVDSFEDDADNFDYDPSELSSDEILGLSGPDSVGEEATATSVVTTDQDNTADTTALVEASGALAASGYGDAITDLGEEEIDHRPVPRISIHAFCETPANTSLLEKAAIDRRLSKAHLTIHMGGVSKAIDQYQTSSTPNLIILETVAQGAEIFSQLAELAEVCDPTTKVVIIGQVNDIILYRELMRQGVSEYIVRPNSPLQIIKSIAELYVDPAAPPIGRTIAFVGARGGVGSSTLAHNVGWCIAEEYNSDTVILDLDLPFGTASLDFDQDASAGLVEALSSPERLDDVLLERLLQKHTDHLSLFTAPSMLDRDYEIDDQAFETVIDVVRGTAPTVVVDVPHIWCSWSKRILTTADEIVIVATPDLAAFRNTKNLVDIVSGARPNDAAPKLVINQFDNKISAVQPEQFEEHVGLAPISVFQSEPQLFGAAATNAEPILEVGAKTKTAQQLRDLSAELLGRAPKESAKSNFSLMSLFKR